MKLFLISVNGDSYQLYKADTIKGFYNKIHSGHGLFTDYDERLARLIIKYKPDSLLIEQEGIGVIILRIVRKISEEYGIEIDERGAITYLESSL